jgi:holo-[acyl-carrier protein] synthase
MDIIGHGVDLVELSRFEQRLNTYGDDDVLGTLFTDLELQQAGTGSRRLQSLAGKFAAKEAVLKALGTGWVDGIGWTDVEIVQSESGRPEIVLHSETAEFAAREGVVKWVLSISNTEAYVIASALALGPYPEKSALDGDC